MSSPAIPDVITIVGSAYFQPIADLIDSLVRNRPPDAPYPSGTSDRENGYSASLTVLLVAVLESYTARLRFLRNAEIVSDGRGVIDLLSEYFPDLPDKEDLVEIFLLRNLVVHNHVWHLDVSNFSTAGATTLSNPKQLGCNTNRNYDDVVDVERRKTRRLDLNANPTAVDRGDVKKVFEVVWRTLCFMNSKDYSHTPLTGKAVWYRGKFRQFDEMIEELEEKEEEKRC